MKTATVTWITYNNYGTLLQAYALQKFVEQLGHENEILSDAVILKEFRETHPTAPRPAPEKAIAAPAKNRLGALLSNPRRLGRVLVSHLNREKYQYPYEAIERKCEEFKAKELKIRQGVSGKMLSELNAAYDAFLCGSDQVWSAFDSIFNPYYYLDFVTKKKIAYGPSLGTDRIPEGTAEKIRELLSDFDAISVRERVSAEQLRDLTGRDVEWVCDPTLLHDRTFWSSFAAGAEHPKGRYLLCYFLENREWYFDYAKKLADRLHLKIRLIPNKWEFLRNENVLTYGIGPKEYVALFENAAYVLTDSYHGTIFSLLFQKDFLHLQRFSDEDPNSQNIRVETFLGYLGLTERIGKYNSPMYDDELRIKDYKNILDRLQQLRRQSQDYLECSFSAD